MKGFLPSTVFPCSPDCEDTLTYVITMTVKHLRIPDSMEGGKGYRFSLPCIREKALKALHMEKVFPYAFRHSLVTSGRPESGELVVIC